MKLAFDRRNRVLLIRYGEHLTRETVVGFDLVLESFIRDHGEVDLIVDFSDVKGRIDSAVVVERAQRPPTMPDRRRVFVVPTDQLYGTFRMYVAYQNPAPKIVRHLEDALNFIGLSEMPTELIEL